MGVYAIWGPPQSGKTTLTIDLAAALGRGGKSVCLISPASYGELAAKLELKITRDRSLVAAKPSTQIKQIAHKVSDLFYILVAPYDYDAFGDDISEDTAKSLLAQARSIYDVVLVDCPSCEVDTLAVCALHAADRVLMLTGSKVSSALWHTAFHRATEIVSKKSSFVCSQTAEFFDYRALCTALDAKPLAMLPYVANADTRKTLYRLSGKVGKEYTREIGKVCALCAGEEVRG